VGDGDASFAKRSNIFDKLKWLKLLIWCHLVLVLFILLRMLFDSFEIYCDWFDHSIAIGAFLVLGIFWPLYFGIFGSGMLRTWHYKDELNRKEKLKNITNEKKD
jgi:hypothetical protein